MIFAVFDLSLLTLRINCSFLYYMYIVQQIYCHFGALACIRMDEVRAALKKMKRNKAPGLLGLVTEMIQATGDTGT